MKPRFPRRSTPPSKPPAEPDPEEVRLPGGDEHILLVEDDRPVADLVERLLRRLGYRVTRAADAGEATAAADGRHYPVLVTDVVLPGRNGLQVAEALLESGAVGAVLFISAYTSAVAIPPDDELGAPAAFLRKPFTFPELAKAVRSLMDGETDGGAERGS